MPTAGWWEALWPDPANVLAAVGVTPGMDVIDLCSGDGWFTLQIARIARHVTAIDIDPGLLDVARHRLTESGVTNCDFVAGDAYDLPRLVRQPADFVFMANAFHGVPDRPRLGRAVRECFKPGADLPSSTGIRARARKRLSLASRAARKPNCACRPRKRPGRSKQAA